MSSSDTTGTTLETAVVEAVMLVTGHDLAGRLEGGLRLEDDLGVDSLALVELVEILQDRLDIVVPDEVTGQLCAIADLIAAMTRLITPGANVAVLPTTSRRPTMTERTVQSINRGFLFLDSHPAGCARLVADMARQVPAVARQGRRPVALIIGSSAGYGLAATVAGIARYGIDGVGLCFEKAPTQRRTATAGWYRSAATARLAADTGSNFSFINGDTFADATKTDVLDRIAATFGGVDYLVYSVAAPRRDAPTWTPVPCTAL